MWRRRVDYVRLELRGTLPEFADEPFWWQRIFLGAAQPYSLMHLRRQFQRIVADPQAQGVLFVVRDFTPGWATAESLRDEIHSLRASGKRVVAYLLNTDTRSYFATCAADELLMPPTAYLYLLGIRIEARFLQDALRMVGLEAEVTAVSPYKAGGDQFVRSDISPEHREQLERLTTQRYDSLITAIAEDRDLAPEQVTVLIDRAPYVAPAACEVCLVDAVCYEDDLVAHLTKSDTHDQHSKQKNHTILDWPVAKHALRIPYRRWQQKYVAVVSVEGVIAPGNSRKLPLPIPIIGGAQAGSESIVQALRRVERNTKIAALVLYVDSPGGDAFASDLIWREVLRVQQHKPIVVSMGNVAASGGYYISACANAIVAQSGTLTGSIGVYALRPIASRLLERLGVNTTVVSRGARTGLLTGTQAPTEDEREVIRQTVFQSYTDFKRRVCDGRGLNEDQLEPIAGGRVWTGQEAHQLGLIDDVGGLPAAIRRARTLAKLPVDPYAPIIHVSHSRKREHILPQPFPSTALAEIPAILAEITYLRILAVMPWQLRE